MTIRTTIRHFTHALMHILLLIVGQTYKVAFSNPITPYMKKRREQLGVLNHKLQFVYGPTSIQTLLPWRLSSFSVFILITVSFTNFHKLEIQTVVLKILE